MSCHNNKRLFLTMEIELLIIFFSNFSVSPWLVPHKDSKQNDVFKRDLIVKNIEAAEDSGKSYGNICARS